MNRIFSVQFLSPENCYEYRFTGYNLLGSTTAIQSICTFPTVDVIFHFDTYFYRYGVGSIGWSLGSKTIIGNCVFLQIEYFYAYGLLWYVCVCV